MRLVDQLRVLFRERVIHDHDDRIGSVAQLADPANAPRPMSAVEMSALLEECPND